MIFWVWMLLIPQKDRGQHCWTPALWQRHVQYDNISRITTDGHFFLCCRFPFSEGKWGNECSTNPKLLRLAWMWTAMVRFRPLGRERWSYGYVLAAPNVVDVVSRCFKMFQDVSRCFKMFQDVSRCFKMFQDVSETQHLFHLFHVALTRPFQVGSWEWVQLGTIPSWSDTEVAEVERQLRILKEEGKVDKDRRKVCSSWHILVLDVFTCTLF